MGTLTRDVRNGIQVVFHPAFIFPPIAVRIFLWSSITMHVAHALPKPLVFEQMAPRPRDATGAGEGAGIIDEAEDMEGEFRGQVTKEISAQERGDCGGNK